MNQKSNCFNRRGFLRGTICSAALAMTGLESADHLGQALASPITEIDPSANFFDTFELDENRVRFYSEKIKKQTRLLFLSDTHLSLDDERGKPFSSFSDRMSKSYNITSHYKTKELTSPAQCFEASLDDAVKSKKFDAIAILGDLISFPSEAGIDWACQKLNDCGIPWYYISGNHDWHYEGMPGSEKDLRAEWTQKRLKPLYQGHNSMAYSVDISGLRLVFIDDSIYEILPEQLAFFKQQVQDGVPMILMMHIPLYAPGRGVGFGCGHPSWGADSDQNWEIERRPQWPKEGHNEVTMEFYRTVFTASNLLGVFAGHIHHQSLDVINGIPQFVVPTNSNQGFMTAEFIPHVL